MDAKREWKNKWYWAGLGTIAASVISDNISEYTKNIPVLKYLVNALKWIYIKLFGFLNLQIKIWVILLIFFAVIFLKKVFSFFSNKEAGVPLFYNYTSDRFHNWTWKWTWKNFGRGWEVDNLTPYCSKCDVELSLGGSLFSPTARCPSCQTLYGEYRQFPIELVGDAEKLIRAKASKIK